MSRFFGTKVVFGVSIAVALFALTSVSFAGFIGDTDGNTVTASAGSTLTFYAATNTTNGNGMSSSPATKASTVDNNTGYMWTTANPADADKWVKFVFTNDTSLSEMVSLEFQPECWW